MVRYPFPVYNCDLGNGVNISYCDEGSGEQTLLFIHGLANYIPVFKHNIGPLSHQYRCVAIDLPGNGLSPGGDFPYTMFFYAECVARFITAKGLQNVTLVGHSMGGQISMIISLRYPDLVHKLVLLGSSGIEFYSDLERTMMKGLLGLGNMMYGDALSLETAIHSSYYHDKHRDARHIINDLKEIMEGEQGKHWRQMVKANIEAMLDENVSRFLPQITHPVLLVYGVHDAFIPNKLVHLTETTEGLAKKGAALIPNCQLELIPLCGHFVQLEAFDRVNNLITDFITGKK